MTETLDVFEEFHADHRKIRDTILDLANALGQRDVAQARELLQALDAMAGPHFRFEEEALYPALREFMGDYVDKLISDHDGAIAKARELATLLQKDEVTQEEAGRAMQEASSLLIHVSDCDGLAIIMERLSQDAVTGIAGSVVSSRQADVPLLRWAEEIRPRASSPA